MKYPIAWSVLFAILLASCAGPAMPATPTEAPPTPIPISPLINTPMPMPYPGSIPTNTPPSPRIMVTEGWAQTIGEYVIFDYPSSWNPVKRKLFGGAILEDWELGIPQVESDQSLGFSTVPFSQLQPIDTETTTETPIVIGGKAGVKWVRRGTDYISYDYYTTGYEDQGCFGVHVTLANPDEVLEQQLDHLVQTIVFK
jgi:hypothetical protein